MRLPALYGSAALRPEALALALSLIRVEDLESVTIATNKKQCLRPRNMGDTGECAI